jgi:hypothetical protein
MLARATCRNPGSYGRPPTTATSKVVLAVAAAPQFGNPAHWGWPNWLAPPAAGPAHHRTHHHLLEEYIR